MLTMRNFLIALLLSSAAASVAFAEDNLSYTYTSEAAYKQAVYGELAVEKGDYKTAIGALSDSIRIEPNFRNHHYRGLAYRGAGDFNAAISDYNRSISSRPTAICFTERGIAYAYLGKAAEATADCDRSISMSPTAEQYARRGYAMILLGKYVNAIADCDKSISLKQTADAFQTRGLAKVHLERYDEAIADCDKSISLEQTNAAFNTRGMARMHQMKYAEAMADYDKSLSLRKTAEAYGNRGMVLLILGRNAEAIADLDRSVFMMPTSETHFYRGVARASLGKYTEAVADLDMAISQKPTAEAFYYRGVARTNLGKYADAVADLDIAISKNPTAEAFYYRGVSRASLGKNADAVADLDMAISKNPTAEAFYYRGVSRASLGKYADAVADLDMAISKNPTAEAFYYRGLALLFVSKSRDTDAMESLSNADRMDPNQKSRYHSAFAAALKTRADRRLLAGDDPQKIALLGLQIADYEKAIEIHPDAKSQVADPLSSAYRKRANLRAAGKDHAGAVSDLSKAIGLDSGDADLYLDRGTARFGIGDLRGAYADYLEAGKINPDGLTPLRTALTRGQWTLADYMVGNGADVNEADGNGATAFMHAVHEGDLEAVRFLKGRGADPTKDGIIWIDKEKGTYYGNVVGTAASKDGDAMLPILKFLVEECGLDVNRGDLSLDGKGRTTYTPLFGACFMGHYDRVSFLLAHGAMIDAEFQGWTPLLVALSPAAKKTDERIPMLLMEKTVPIPPKVPHYLLYAAYQGFNKVIAYILDRGMTIHDADGEGNTALHYAVSGKDSPETVSLLLDRGIGLEKANRSNWTALHFAARNGRKNSVSILIARGADVNAKAATQDNGKEVTPLSLASSGGFPEIVDLLRKAGAKESG